MNIIIREFTNSEAEEISKVAYLSRSHTYKGIISEEEISRRNHQAYNPDAIRQILDYPQYTILFIAILEGNIVGFVQPGIYNYWDEKTIDPSKAQISRIYLHPDYKKRGIGGSLLNEAQNWIKNQGFKEYVLFVHHKNLNAIGFYQHLGFVEQPENRDEDQLCMYKQIF
ncbi:MAG: GNAT family N-acetyltransferase [Candidatus Heimdallarchaeota archaeon]|nr:GNAT family N-acetyltransferase [Candidatus Heimdallarchaeota archaeon]MDH5646739.1 GNAT family N-acetyltransferase [Candidatus Heimdallarchaeota archaeon]